ncbi:MAG TPA: hypothetical protein VL500_02315 [Candidatus Eisenbacteria bacterium]|nr:hypothetical protein [Candidatus Eisenbacteria bacterium]
MPSLSSCLGIIAAAIHLSAYVVYARQAGRGETRLNTATWILWVFLSALNAASYLMMTGDLAKSAVSLGGATACTITLAYALAKGRASPVAPADAAALAAGLVAAAAWWIWRSATFANLILQAGFIISMVPTYRRLFRDPRAEKPLPWLMWGSAYAVTLVVVLLRWQGHAPDLAYPGINLVTHSGVGWSAIVFSRRRGP